METIDLPAIAETHTAMLFMVGDRVYKRKKAVAFPFVDFRSRAARQAACHREVVLNRRLAPDVYLGVADMSMEGTPCEHFVVMRRMPDDRRLSTMVQGRDDVTDA